MNMSKYWYLAVFGKDAAMLESGNYKQMGSRNFAKAGFIYGYSMYFDKAQMISVSNSNKSICLEVVM